MVETQKENKSWANRSTHKFQFDFMLIKNLQTSNKPEKTACKTPNSVPADWRCFETIYILWVSRAWDDMMSWLRSKMKCVYLELMLFDKVTFEAEKRGISPSIQTSKVKCIKSIPSYQRSLQQIYKYKQTSNRHVKQNSMLNK